MKTYIDDYVSRLRKAYQAEIGARGKLDVQAMLRDLLGYTALTLANGTTLHPSAEVELRFMEGIGPFIFPRLAGVSAAALTVTSETVGFFRTGNISRAVKAVAEADVETAGSVYLDFPHGAFPVGRDRQIRMILARQENGRLRITSAVAPRGSNKGRRFSWFAGEASVCGAADTQTWVAETDRQLLLGLNLDEPDQPIEPLLGRKPNQVRQLLRQIERVMFLAIAQRRSLIDAGDEVALIDLPHIGLADPKRRSGNSKQIERKNSFFRIKRLPHLHGIAVEQATYSGSRTVFRRGGEGPYRFVQVRGFYRMQPYGAKHRLRRLIWIPAHTRWVRDDGRIDMIALPRPMAA